MESACVEMAYYSWVWWTFPSIPVVVGPEGVIVEVEVDYSNGLPPAVIIVGLPDAAVQESRERVQTVVQNAGLNFPRHKVAFFPRSALIGRSLSVNCHWKVALFLFQRQYIIRFSIYDQFRSDRMTWNDKPGSLSCLNKSICVHPTTAIIYWPG